jgi:NAD(P)H-hydrate epimerase
VTYLASAAQARALDGEASAEWGLHPFALVEAAGRTCAEVFAASFPRFADYARAGGLAMTVLAGSGNNAADALVMLRSLLLRRRLEPEAAAVLVSRLPAAGESSPLGAALRALEKTGVPVIAWDAEAAGAVLSRSAVIIDGIAGTGIAGPLRGKALEMAEAVNRLRAMPEASTMPQTSAMPVVVSIDLPSGGGDFWRPGMLVLAVDATLAIEPQKSCLYVPAFRPLSGRILPVNGIFPPGLIERHKDAELLSWPDAARRVPGVRLDAHKYERGLVEIRAGSTGAAGAAKLAAQGAQSAGAGLVRLIVDDSLYPLLAPGASGIMVAPGGALAADNRFRPDAVLLGPGWGRGPDRERLLEQYLPREEQGLPLILDADAIHLAAGRIFHENAILTPHAGEFAAYTGLAVAEILADPVPVLRRVAQAKKACILFKSHVLYVAGPGGQLGIIDGMNPALAAGGSGDVLAGICAGIAARQARASAFDGYACACAAAALFVESAVAPALRGRFIDPGELAGAAASLAGGAWLPAETMRYDHERC